MSVTKSYLVELGYEVTDTSSKHSFDFLAVKGEESIKVEVKGTTAVEVDTVLMSKNEVNLHRREAGQTALAIVAGILLTERGESARADGGSLEYIYPWDIQLWTVTPLAYTVSR